MSSVEVNESLTQQVARLARLELSPEETKAFAAQLREILDYVDQLQEVEVQGIEPLLTPIDLQTPMREDLARPSPTDSEGRPKILGSAPETLQGGFKVPQIV